MICLSDITHKAIHYYVTVKSKAVSCRVCSCFSASAIEFLLALMQALRQELGMSKAKRCLALPSPCGHGHAGVKEHGFALDLMVTFDKLRMRVSDFNGSVRPHGELVEPWAASFFSCLHALNCAADFKLFAPRPAPVPQRTSATRPWRPRSTAADQAGSPTAPCAGGSPRSSG